MFIYKIYVFIYKMAIRKYTKKRRRRSLRKLRGGTVTIDRVNERKTARIAPDELFTRKSGFDVERRRDGRRVGLVHSENARYAARTASPPPMTAREREARFKALERDRAAPEERRGLFEADVKSRARAVAARGRRNSKRFDGLDDRTSTCWDLIDPKDRIDCRDITRRQLDDRISTLRPTRRSAPRSPPALTWSASQSPPALTWSASQSTRSRSPRSLRRRSPTPPPRSPRRRSPTPPPRSLRRRPPRSLRRRSPTPPLRTA